MTTRLRAGFFIEAKMKEDKDYYFGYITHAGLEYDIAFAMPVNALKKYKVNDKTHIHKEGIDYKLGMLQTFNDIDGNDIYTVKIFAGGKLNNLVIYPSQHKEMIKLGHHINTYQEGRLMESFVNLNQE
jgi:hypothetical protein